MDSQSPLPEDDDLPLGPDSVGDLPPLTDDDAIQPFLDEDDDEGGSSGNRAPAGGYPSEIILLDGTETDLTEPTGNETEVVESPLLLKPELASTEAVHKTSARIEIHTRSRSTPGTALVPLSETHMANLRDDFAERIRVILGEYPLHEGERLALLEALLGYLQPLEEVGFGIQYLVQSIGRFLERTAPPADGPDDGAARARRMDMITRLEALLDEDRREAMACATTGLKAVIKDMEGLRQRLDLLEETNANAYSALNLNEHELAILRTRHERMLAAVAHCADRVDVEAKQVLDDRQADPLQRVNTAEQVIFALANQVLDPAIAADHDQELTARDAQIAELSAQCSQLRVSLATAEERERGLETRLNDDLAALRQQYEEKLAELMSLERGLAEAQETLECERAERQQQGEQQQRLSALARDDAARIDELQIALAAAQAEAAALREAPRQDPEQEQALAALQQQLTQTEQAAAEQAGELAAARQRVSELAAQAAEGQEQAAAAQAQIVELDAVHADLHATIARLEAETAQVRQRGETESGVRADLEDLCDRLRAQVAELETERAALSEQLTTVEAAAAAQRAAHAASQEAQVEDAQAQLAEAQQQLAEQTRQCTDARQAEEALAAQLADKDASLAVQQERIQALLTESAEQHQQLDELQQLADGESRRARDLDQELTELRGQCTELTQSLADRRDRERRLAAEAEAIRVAQETLDQERSALAQEQATLAQQRSELDALAAAVAEQQAQVAAQEATIAAGDDDLAQRQQAFAAQCAEREAALAARAEELEAQAQRYAESQEALNEERRRMAAEKDAAAARIAALQETAESVDERLASLRAESDERGAALRQQLEQVEEERLQDARRCEQERLAMQARLDQLDATLAVTSERRQEERAALDRLALLMVAEAQAQAALSEELSAASDEDQRSAFAAIAADYQGAAMTMPQAAEDHPETALPLDADALGEACEWMAGAGADLRQILIEQLAQWRQQHAVLAERDEEAADLQQRLDALSASLAAEEERAAEALTRGAELDQQRLAAQEAAQELQAALNQLRDEQSQTVQELAALTRQADRQQSEWSAHNEALRADQARLEEALAQRQAELERLQAQAAGVGARAALASDCYLQALQRVLRLIEQAAATPEQEAARDRLAALLAELAPTLDEAWPEEVVAELPALLSQLIDTIAARLAALSEQCASAEQERATLDEVLVARDATCLALEARCTDSEAQRVRLGEELSRLRAAHSELEATLAARSQELGTLKQAHAGLGVDAEAQAARCQRLEEELADLRPLRDQLRLAREDLSAEQARAEAGAGACRTILEAVRALSEDAMSLSDNVGLLTVAASKRMSRSTMQLSQAARGGEPQAASEVGRRLVEQVDRQLAALHGELITQRDRRLALEETTREQERRLLAAEDRCAALEGRQEQLDGQLASARQRIALLEPLQDQLAEAQRAQEALAAAHQREVRQVVAQREELQAVIQTREEELHERQAAARATIEELQRQLAETTDAADALRTQLAAVEAAATSRAADLAASLQERDQRLDAVLKECDVLRRERVEVLGLQSRIETLNEKLSAANKEIVGLRSEIDRSAQQDPEAQERAVLTARRERDECARALHRLERQLNQEHLRGESRERSGRQQLRQWEDRVAEAEAAAQDARVALDASQGELRVLRKELAGLRARVRSMTQQE